MADAIPAGWYPNPWNDTEELYWSGAEWTGISRTASRRDLSAAAGAEVVGVDSVGAFGAVGGFSGTGGVGAAGATSSDIEESTVMRPVTTPIADAPANARATTTVAAATADASPQPSIVAPVPEAVAFASTGGAAGAALADAGFAADPSSAASAGAEFAPPQTAAYGTGNTAFVPSTPALPQASFAPSAPAPSWPAPSAPERSAPATGAPLSGSLATAAPFAPGVPAGDAYATPAFHPQYPAPDAASIRWALGTQPLATTSNRHGRFGLTAMIVGIVAVVFAIIPGLSFAAWLPAFAAIAFGIVGFLGGHPRAFALTGIITGGAALAVGTAVSIWFLVQLGALAR